MGLGFYLLSGKWRSASDGVEFRFRAGNFLLLQKVTKNSPRGKPLGYPQF